MKQISDHPDIRAMEAGGYPSGFRSPHNCPCCGEDIGRRSYEINGEFLCESCFTEWVQDYLRTNPVEMAKALSVPTRYVG